MAAYHVTPMLVDIHTTHYTLRSTDYTVHRAAASMDHAESRWRLEA